MNINIETLRKTKGIGQKTLERIIEQYYIDNELKKFNSEYIPSDTYTIDKDINLWQGDCLELMNHIPNKSVDMILCDLPYGTTACSWDEIIPFELLWSHYKRIIKDNGAIVLFGSEPFSTKLRMSNLDWYRYDWIWEKNKANNFLTAKHMPMKFYENISVFYKDKALYNPQKYKIIELSNVIDIFQNGSKQDQLDFIKNGKFNYFGIRDNRKTFNVVSAEDSRGMAGTKIDRYAKPDNGDRYPKNILRYNLPKKPTYHPTQKPVELLEYLIKTYTNENMMVLDNTMGSGSTGVACKNTNRKFIGIELDQKYFNIAKERIGEC